MNTIDREQLFVDQSKVLSVSTWIRIGLRAFIATALVVSVFLFLFYPAYASFATYPIPVAVLLFALISVFSRVYRRLFRRRLGIESLYKRRTRFGSGVTFLHAVGKVVAALLLAAVLIVGTYFEIPALGIAAAMILLVATVVESPQLGFFTTSTEIDKKARIRRHTLASLSDTFPDDRFELKGSSRSDSQEESEDPAAYEDDAQQAESRQNVAPPLITGLDVENGRDHLTTDPNH